ncbi:BgTH12-01641 [Blumeria graminis f. sp. triticale]|uniref:Bgt-258 n=3 Tax=Blumeria graminis TaxID=34373 RepID=A0A061HJR1_BLUGR|nr:Cytoplasmic response regulator [Blumeria graminis f. sp. tritici 96224]CAD6501389.1 BgTH12-01641 [Blumeria graminis f. sp. triticale]VDB83880.1 Bgt-258 [Blumeria graminis f. sp. tritici]
MSTSDEQLLRSIGIPELLDADERPTFIIDAANKDNFNPGSVLQITFANSSLRGRDKLLNMVTGNIDLYSSGISVINDFPAFKYWALSFIINGEPQDISLPQYHYAGLSWTCNTLRKRLRLISGNSSVSTTRASMSILSSPSVLDEEDFTWNQSNKTRSGKKEISSKNPSKQPKEVLNCPRELALLNDMSHVSTSGQPQSDNVSIPSSTLTLPIENKNFLSKTAGVRQDAIKNSPENLSLDWTRLPTTTALPRHIQFVQSIDWAATSLGPIEKWSLNLRVMCNLIMASPHPAAIYWGDEHIVIYNEAYIILAGKKHPQLMGQTYKQAWGEIWGEIEGAFSIAKNSGRPIMKDDDCLFIRRNGYLEESYFSWSIIPIIGSDGSVVGLYNPVFDKTRQKIVERRMALLRLVGEQTASARTVKSFWVHVVNSLEVEEYDIPFALLYSVGDDLDSDVSSTNNGPPSQFSQCILEGSLGIPVGHRALRSPLDFKHSNETFAPSFRQAMKVNNPIVLSTEDKTLPKSLVEGLASRGFGDLCRIAVVCPIRPTTGEITLGFLVMGINSRRPFDDDYSLFIQLLSRQLATSMASVVLFEDEIKRGEKAARLAALNHQELSNQLYLRTQEAVESETKFTRMAELAPVGMFIANNKGEVTYNNEMWWEISRHPRSEKSTAKWMDSIRDEDRESVENSWKELVENKTSLTIEFRFKTPWHTRTGVQGDTWVLMSAYPERNDEGQLKSVFGSVTNISQQKWAEDFQKRRMEEAIEMKRQQENFIDMTSHEMRNPLSAILQCSDEIGSSIMAYKSEKTVENLPKDLVELLNSNIDASQTIALCAQHQKRIVDDILTLSKLDSALLMVTPISVQPVSVVQRALKMFEGELSTNDITLKFRLEDTYTKLDIDWVKLDPSRLLQVLINLTSNAIKFTRGQVKRIITVSVGASKERIDDGYLNVAYFPSRSKLKDFAVDKSEWGEGEEVFLHFAVEDTGRGLDDKEKKLLFQRFSQASPRTHVQYGGSGLGLFISRELTELQGGEIGVISEPGIGSTFAFYIKCRRAEKVRSEAFSKLTSGYSTQIKETFREKGDSSTKIQFPLSIMPIRGSNIRGHFFNEESPKLLPKGSMDYTNQRILIVEDNLVNQRVLQKQLSKKGFKTSLANHGGEALEFLKTTKFWKENEQDGLDLTVILMDLEMPFMDGLTCSRHIRDAEVEGKIVGHVPIIAVTANARLEQIEAAVVAGVDDVQSKPFLIQDLLPKIEKYSSINQPSISRVDKKQPH